MPEHPWPCRGLYLLTPDEPDTARLQARVGAVIGAASLVQYRNKCASPTLQRTQAGALLRQCREAGVALIINDDPALAADIGADGVHLGEEDGDMAAARAVLGSNAIIGVSCYNDFERARQMAQSGASYLALGAFFPSATKPAARRADPALLGQCVALRRPLVAIGGITADNGASLIAAGADCLAVIGGVFDAPDPPAAARAYRALFA